MPDSTLHHRRSIRLKGYDYTQPGAYFVTLLAYQRQCLFCKITNGQVSISPIGQILQDQWLKLPDYFPFLALGTFVIMPNHLHGILILKSVSKEQAPHQQTDEGSGPKGTQPGSVGAILQTYKSVCTRRARQYADIRIWQPNYYEHIIRTEEEWERIHQYILANPVNWVRDDYWR